MTRKDFDSMVQGAVAKGEELKQSKAKGNGERKPRKPGVKAVVEADVTAHPDSEWQDVVKRSLLILGVAEDLVERPDFIEALTIGRLLPRLAKQTLERGVNFTPNSAE